MNSSTVCSLCLTLCLILIFHSPLPTKARSDVHHKLLGVGPDLIDQVCNETIEDNILCMKILKGDPEIVLAKNFVELAEAILKLGLKKGIEGQNFLKGLVEGKHDPGIEECATSDYDGVINSFRSALGEMKNDLLAANYSARIAGDGADNCNTTLVAERIQNPAISDLNHQVSMLSFIAFCALDKIH
ncbi:unnamed protein product [Sphenostylis stenocarpa]|uniref:Pectinesterase inhibitor domain-containing protein n=1 Tax=Sphenostylis stenocarpa TaxID=92480 RepID=A0AA86VUG0_9FABA|nr:unnamed protein product [Sphenostylis stenocarpa]